MAPSTRTQARCGATTTGTTGPTVSDSIMRTRSGIAINPPTEQDNKCKRSAVHQLSPVPDNPNCPKPRPLARRSSSMTFEDYAQLLAHPRKQKVKPSVDSVPSDIQLQSDCAPDTSDTDDDAMGDVGNNDDHDNTSNKGNDQADEDEDEDDQDSGHAKSSPDNIESYNDNNAKDTDEEAEDDENNEDQGRTNTSPARRLRPRTVKKANYNFDDGSPTSSSDSSYTSSQAKREHPTRSDQVSTHESDADKDLDHESPSSPPAKHRKTSSAVNTTSANTSQNTTRSTTICNKHVHAPTPHSADDHTPAGIVFGPTLDNEHTENEEELPGHLNRGRLCQEGTHEAQEFGRKTAEEARVIGAKYGKSTRAVLIEAGLSINHSRSESDWNAHQHWFMDNHPRKDKESIVDWKERQCKHYHVMGKDNEQWDTIRKYSITSGNIVQSRTKTILSMREDIARKFSAYSRLEGVEAVSGFVTGSDLIVNLINEHQLDAHAILDWVVTAMKAKGYNISVPQFMGGVGAYEILLSKPNEAPRDRYRRIWPIMVLENTSKFGYRPKAVQWRKLLDYAFQYKFMIKNWPDDVTPIGPDFNPHNLSSRHLKLLVVPFIKCKKAHSYYEAELRTEAENLFEIEKKKPKGKRRDQECTVEDVMSELDVDAPEIEFAAWPDECLKQLSDKVPEMFDIPLVTSTLDVVLRKLVDSVKFKASIPEDILVVHEAHSDGLIPSTAEMLPGGHESLSPTLSSPTLPSNQHHATMTTPVHRREGSHPTRVPDLFDRESRPVRPTRREEPAGGGRQQANLPFKAKKTSRVDPTLALHMEEHPTHSHNDTDLEHEPYPRCEDRNFIAPNCRHEYSRSPPVYPERAESSRTRYYRPTYRQRETTPSADNGDYSYPQQYYYSRRQNQGDDQSQRFQVRGAGDSYREDGSLRFRY